ncbi:MAG: FAD-dependent thymidylate synthase [Sedimentisphaerales bacterium]|nr:FAD-dependent thymidylate synthase [Sedimentisphaerales bacterium]
MHARVELIAITPDAEKLIETAGRTCYDSTPKAKPNSARDFIANIIRNGHHSVLEHACATFRITEASRSFTHQLVRHRLCAFSQRSQRYVDEKSFAFVEPESIRQEPEARRLFGEFLNEAKDAYGRLQELGISNEDARFVLPNAVQSEIVISANFRQLRHIFCVRCDRHAQWEIREVALQMLRIMKKEAPSVFRDFEINEETATAHTPFWS